MKEWAQILRFAIPKMTCIPHTKFNDSYLEQIKPNHLKSMHTYHTHARESFSRSQESHDRQ